MGAFFFSRYDLRHRQPLPTLTVLKRLALMLRIIGSRFRP